MWEGVCETWDFFNFCEVLKPGPGCDPPPPDDIDGQYHTVSVTFCLDVYDEGNYSHTAFGCLWCFYPTIEGVDGLSGVYSSIIAERYGFLPSDTRKWEPFDCADPDEKITRIADWKDASNFLVKFRPTELI